MPVSTGVLDPSSVEMAKIYVTTNHKEGYKWIDILLEEYTLQKDYLKTLESQERYLGVDGQRLLDHSKRSLKQLTSLKKTISTRKKDNQENDREKVT